MGYTTLANVKMWGIHLHVGDNSPFKGPPFLGLDPANTPLCIWGGLYPLTEKYIFGGFWETVFAKPTTRAESGAF